MVEEITTDELLESCHLRLPEGSSRGGSETHPYGQL